MDRRNQVGTALVGVAVVLFVTPALFPVQPVLMHNTQVSSSMPPSQLEEADVRMIAYENLSDRGKELYRTTLENGGRYRVSQGEGAPEFAYPTEQAVRRAYENQSSPVPGQVVVVRPEDDGRLPQADEHFFPAAEDENVTDQERQRLMERMQRFDSMQTRTAQPSLGSTPQLLRLAAVLLAVLSLGVGGYLLSSK